MRRPPPFRSKKKADYYLFWFREGLVNSLNWVEPLAITHLLDAATPAFRKLVESKNPSEPPTATEWNAQPWHGWTWESIRSGAASGGVLETDLVQQIESWAESLNLSVAWIHESAFRTTLLDEYRRENGITEPMPGFALPSPGPEDEDDTPFRFEVRPWDPFSHDWGEYREIVEELFSKALRAHKRSQEKTANSTIGDSGWKERFRKSGTAGKLEERFDWFVRYQVLGESQVDISRSCSASPTTINRAIKEISETLGIRRRQRSGTKNI